MTANPDDEAFISQVNSPLSWWLSAESLRECAEVVGGLHVAAIQALMDGETSQSKLRHLMGTDQVFLMLAGLAIENLAKGLLFHRKKVSITKGTLKGSGLKAHGANKFLDWAGVDLSQEEREFIARLDKAVRWSGRYPVPLNAAELEAQSTFVSSKTDVDDFKKLFQRLALELNPKGQNLRVFAFHGTLDPRGPKGGAR